MKDLVVMSVDWVEGYAELCGGRLIGKKSRSGPGSTVYICFGGLFAPSGLTAEEWHAWESAWPSG